jgi:drug/metabolite transporter (DMT)-like permease
VIRRVALLALLCFIWGSTWLAIKIGLDDVPPFLGAAIRFTVAAAILLVLGRIQRVPFPRTRRAHAGLLVLGLTTFAISYGVVYWSEQYLSSGLTAVLFATHPLLVLLLAHVVIEAERITIRRLLGVVLGLAGVVMIFRSDFALAHPRAPLAAAVVMLSPLTAATNNVAIKRWGSQMHVYNLTTLPMAYGAAALFGVSLLVEDSASARWTAAAVGSIAYLAVFGSVIAFVVFYSLLKRVTVTALSLISYVFPVVAVFLGWAVRGESLDATAGLGAAAILLGIAIATWRRRSAPVAALPEEIAAAPERESP